MAKNLMNFIKEVSVMKRQMTIIILCVLMVCIGIATRSGAGTYDLNGEWDSVYVHCMGRAKISLKLLK